jgi:hypothetical protein
VHTGLFYDVNKQRDCGGMVYTADLKSAAFGIEGSSPSSRTNLVFMMISSSPSRNTFQKEKYIQRCKEQGKVPNKAYIKMYEQHNIDKLEREENPEWQKNNMEYDMRTSDWMVTKVRASEGYAQNLYAAMCNREFQKNEVWPLLKNQTWGASWRYAGGIIADMRGEGDYMDWYCSGIQGRISEAELAEMTAEQQERRHWYEKNFVPESVVTDEILADLQKLGWLVVDTKDDISI